MIPAGSVGGTSRSCYLARYIQYDTCSCSVPDWQTYCFTLTPVFISCLLTLWFVAPKGAQAHPPWQVDFWAFCIHSLPPQEDVRLWSPQGQKRVLCLSGCLESKAWTNCRLNLQSRPQSFPFLKFKFPFCVSVVLWFDLIFSQNQSGHIYMRFAWRANGALEYKMHDVFRLDSRILIWFG